MDDAYRGRPVCGPAILFLRRIAPVSVTSDLLTVRRRPLRGRYHPSDHPAGRPVPDGGRGPVRRAALTPAPRRAAPASVRRTAFQGWNLERPLQTAGRVRLPYTRRRGDARCVTSLSRLPDVPELNSYDPEFFAGHALLLVTDTTASGSLPPILHTADRTDGHGTVRLQRPLPARNQCVTQDMATWLRGRRSLSLGALLLGGSEPRPPGGACPCIESRHRKEFFEGMGMV
ncbi:MAG: hypothetical protein ACLU38_14935 [Dysosmobacter sp.]